MLAQHDGQENGTTFGAGDFNADGGIGFDDLLILAQHYELHGAAGVTTPVPEPAVMVLCVAAFFRAVGSVELGTRPPPYD